MHSYALNDLGRRSNTGFGIRDLPQKSTTKAKFRPLGLNRDFLGPFLDLSGTFSRYFHEKRIVAYFQVFKSTKKRTTTPMPTEIDKNLIFEP